MKLFWIKRIYLLQVALLLLCHASLPIESTTDFKEGSSELTSTSTSQIETTTLLNTEESTSPDIVTDIVYIEDSTTTTPNNETNFEEVLDTFRNETYTPKNYKFISNSSDIVVEYIDFTLLRLKHLALSTSNKISEIKIVQNKEFEVNDIYKKAWLLAASVYNDRQKNITLKKNKNSSTTRVPDEYHIALLAYSSLNTTPELHDDFNKKTQALCSGDDIDNYQYKSYFKLMILAIQALGKETKFKSVDKFLYRGISGTPNLKIGQRIAFQYVISTSNSLERGMNFVEKAVFEIHGPLKGTSLSMKHYASLENGDEIIVSPFQTYKVESISAKTHDVYVLVPYDKLDGVLCGESSTNLKTRKGHQRQISRSSERINVCWNPYGIIIFVSVVTQLVNYLNET